jgi:hypothetical protein
LSSDDHNPQERVESKIETSRDDRYSSWKDSRHQSKHMKGWWFEFRFELKHFLLPIFRRYSNLYLGPWPLKVLILICVCFYLFQ